LNKAEKWVKGDEGNYFGVEPEPWYQFKEAAEKNRRGSARKEKSASLLLSSVRTPKRDLIRGIFATCSWYWV